MAKAGYDRASELKAFDDTKTGVKGLVDAGSTKIPRIFVHPHPQPHGPTTTSATTSIIPIIDLSNPHRPAVVRQLGAAAEKFGVFQVVEHGVPTNVLDEMLQGVRRFHEESPEVKKEYYSRDSSRKVYFNSNFDLFQAHVANWRDTLFCLMAPEPPSPEEIPLACSSVHLNVHSGKVYLQKIAKVHNQSTRDRRYINPLIFVKYLQPTNVVLKKNGEEALIRMLAGAKSKMRFRA